ncbi:MAG: hypothetical protein IJ635_12145 [Bacteroidaceae bacterium]|nr:hypothetical protein [Bacteroidaceae bacterium]
MKKEEPQMVPPDDVGTDLELKSEDQEAVEAMRKFTDEDEDELGEISVKSILGGDFLMSKFMIKQVAFVMFCVVLMIIYTGNRYDSQQDAILIDSLRGRLQEVKYNVLTQSSELMNLTRQSNVEKRLSGTRDSLLHNSITPPFLIKTDNRRRVAEEEGPKEVLVDSVERDTSKQNQETGKQNKDINKEENNEIR